MQLYQFVKIATLFLLGSGLSVARMESRIHIEQVGVTGKLIACKLFTLRSSAKALK